MNGSSLEEIERSIAEVTERVRHGRIDRGLPPEPPEPFVDETLSFALLDDITPFRDIFVKYARLVAEGSKPPVTLAKLAHYGETASLLRYSMDDNVRRFASGVRIGLDIMERVNNGEDIGMITLSLALEFMTVNDMLYYDYQSAENAYSREERVKADVKALREDSERFTKEYDEAVRRLKEDYADE